MKLSLEKVNLKKIINESYEINNFISLIENGLLAQFQDNFPLSSSNVGVLYLNNDELDMVTIALTIKEKVSISSTVRIYYWLKETLKKFMELK